MGNNHSRHPSRYPPKHAYYSERERRGQKPRKGGGAWRHFGDDMDYREYAQHYPSHSHSRSQSQPQPRYEAYEQPTHGYDLYNGHQPIRPPPLPFPNAPPPNSYPVIPSVPQMQHFHQHPPPAMPHSSYVTQPTMHMPEPATTQAPVIPGHGHIPHNQPVIPPLPHAPTPHPHNQSSHPPVIPSPPPAFPQPQGVPVVPGHDHASSANNETSPYEMHEGRPLAPGQYGYAPAMPMYERPESLHFRHNPLPTPPKDVFELSPYMGLLRDLRKPPEETLLRRSATSPQYATGYIVSPVGSHASREKKPRKGLFRSLSNRLAGKSKRDYDQQAAAVPAVQPVIFTTMPFSPGVIPPGSYPTSVPPPGTVWQSADGRPMHSPHDMPHHGARAPSPQPPRAPPSPAPSHRSHRSRRSRHSRHSRLDSPSPASEPLKIAIENAFAGLTHLSPHRIHWDKKSYPSAFHLLEALRFMGAADPGLAEHIRHLRTADEVKAFVSQNAASSRPDWEQIVVPMMDEVLYTKFIQHPDLRRLLLSTGVAALLFADHDNFWGDGPLGRGANELGRALERVRERLLQEGFTMES